MFTYSPQEKIIVEFIKTTPFKSLHTLAKMLRTSERLLGHSWWLLGCCYAVAKVHWVVARVLLCGC